MISLLCLSSFVIAALWPLWFAVAMRKAVTHD